MVERDADEGDRAEPDLPVVEERHVPLDDAALLELAHALEHGRGAQAHLGGELHVRDAPLQLQDLEDADVEGMETVLTHRIITAAKHY